MASKRATPPPSNLQAARSNDRRQALERLRDTLAADLDVAEPNVRAQLAAQYRATLAELAAIAPVEVSKRDELAKKRAARAEGRGAAAKPAASAGRGRQRRSGA